MFNIIIDTYYVYIYIYKHTHTHTHTYDNTITNSSSTIQLFSGKVYYVYYNRRYVPIYMKHSRIVRKAKKNYNGTTNNIYLYTYVYIFIIYTERLKTLLYFFAVGVLYECIPI